MTGVITAFAFTWLLMLTLLFVALARHVATLQLGAITNTATTFDVDADGPEIGTHVSALVSEILSEHEVVGADLMLVLFSSSCEPCTERAAEIAQRPSNTPRLVALLAGRHEAGILMLETYFDRSDAFVIKDPEAHLLAKELGIESVPFAVRVFDGVVQGKAYIRSVEDYDLLIRGEQKRGHRDGSEAVHPTRSIA